MTGGKIVRKMDAFDQFALDYQVLRGDEVCVAGRNIYVVVASDFSGKLPVPPQLRDVLGEPAPLLPA